MGAAAATLPLSSCLLLARVRAAAARFSLSVLSVCRERLNATGLWKSCVQGNGKALKEKEKKEFQIASKR